MKCLINKGPVQECAVVRGRKKKPQRPGGILKETETLPSAHRVRGAQSPPQGKARRLVHITREGRFYCAGEDKVCTPQTMRHAETDFESKSKKKWVILQRGLRIIEYSIMKV